MAILSVLLMFLVDAVSAVSSYFVTGHDRTRSGEKGRAVIELISREVTPAVIDTRMQFVILPGEELSDVGALDVAVNSPGMIWMAPLGPGGELRCVGYYLTGNKDRKQYRLKRIYVKHDNPHGYFPNLVDFNNARSIENRTSPVDAGWLTDNWDADAFDDVSDSNDRVMISTVSDGVVAFWIRALDSLGNPVPLLSSSTAHPASDLIYNSAAYFYMANGEAFDDGSSFVYLRKNRLTMKANRLPESVELAIVMVSEDSIGRGGAIPVQENVLAGSGALDLDASIRQYTEKLKDAGFIRPEVFRTRVKLTKGG